MENNKLKPYNNKQKKLKIIRMKYIKFKNYRRHKLTSLIYNNNYSINNFKIKLIK